MPSDFKNLLNARFLFVLATQIQSIVLGWHMYDLTKDPLYLGLIGLVEAIPALSLALYAGMVVDHSRPLIVYRRVLYLNGLSAAVLLVSQVSTLQVPHHLEIIALFTSSFISGLARAFQQPTVYAVVPRIIPRESFAKYAAWMTTSLQGARIAGPALGGILYGFVGMFGSALSVLVLLVLAVAQVFRIKKELGPAHVREGSPLTELLIGAKFVFTHKILLPALSLDMVSVFFGGVTALLPIYAAEILSIGPMGLGFLRAAPAVGAVLTGLWLTRVEFRARAGRWLFWAVSGFGVSILVFSLSHNYILSFVAMIFVGGFDSVSMVIRTAAVQLSSPDEMRGRISAVNSIFIGSSNELGEFESGVTAKLLGTVNAAVFGGIICLLTVAATAALSPTLRRMNLRELEKTS